MHTAIFLHCHNAWYDSSHAKQKWGPVKEGDADDVSKPWVHHYFCFWFS